jgi:hypothetical protein
MKNKFCPLRCSVWLGVVVIGIVWVTGLVKLTIFIWNKL